MDIGENIKLWRKKKGLTQAELGRKLGITQSAIGQFEKGKSSIKIETIEKIAEALEISADALLMGAEIDHSKISISRSKTAKSITKRLALVKFLDCIYDCADITKIKIRNKESNEIVYNDEYVSIGTDQFSCGEIALDEDAMNALLDTIETICRNIISLCGQRGDSYDAENYSQKDNKFSYEFSKETLDIVTKVSEKYDKMSFKEINELKNILDNDSNTEEFQPITPLDTTDK